MKKIYRGIEYHKYRLIFILSFIVLFLSMCTPKGNDVQIHYKTDTTITDTITKPIKNGN